MNNRRHSGEVALVTGANKGIGREISRRLAAEGVTVYLGARDEDRGRKAARDLAGDGADVRFLQLDVTDQAQIGAAVNSITLLYANALRKDGILVNSASPGFVATDLNGHRGHLTAEQGADLPVKLALLGADGPTGTFLGQDESLGKEAVPW